MNPMKIIIAAIVMGLSVLVIPVKACEISFKVTSNEKPAYNVGEELVIAVKVVYTHRNCPEGIEATKFSFSGFKTLGATPWKEISEGQFERKFKLQVSEESKGNHILTATRVCDKDGGTGSIKIEVK
jgi:hypothetical protein